MTATAAAKKIRYHNKDTNTFAWEFPDELPEYALEQEGVQKQLGRASSLPADAPAEKVNDYSADIDHWREELRTALDDLRAARDTGQRINARDRAEQYKLAIDVYTAAEMTPAVVTQFGCYRADFMFRVPPRLEEYQEMSPTRYGSAHRYITADPVEIAYLRTIADYEEVPVGSVYSRAPGQREGLWETLEKYERQKSIGQAV